MEQIYTQEKIFDINNDIEDRLTIWMDSVAFSLILNQSLLCKMFFFNHFK